MNVPRSPSSHDDDPPSGGGNGNGGDHDDDLGRSLNPCKLGDDCPYAGSMRWLFDERLKREQTEGQIVSRVDILADKLQGAILLVEKFERTLRRGFSGSVIVVADYELLCVSRQKTSLLDR